MKEAYEIQYISKITIESESHTKALNTAIKNKLVEIENVMCVRKKKIK